MIIVTGMHRSGTSAVAELLNEMGGDLGPRSDMLAADDYNARGYWENLRVLTCNDRLVLGGGDRYPMDYYRLSRAGRPAMMRWRMQWLWARAILSHRPAAIERRSQRLHDEMQQVAERFDGITVKDPRFCLTLPLWRKLDAVERVLVVIRRPDQCAASLKRRNGLPRRFGLKMWRDYHEALLAALPGLPVVLIDFNRLLGTETCDEELDRIAAFAGRSLSAGERTRLRDDVVNPTLTTSPEVTQPVPRPIADLYGQLWLHHGAYDTPRPFQTGSPF